MEIGRKDYATLKCSLEGRASNDLQVRRQPLYQWCTSLANQPLEDPSSTPTKPGRWQPGQCVTAKPEARTRRLKTSWPTWSCSGVAAMNVGLFRRARTRSKFQP